MQIDVPDFDDLSFVINCTNCNGTGESWALEKGSGRAACWKCSAKNNSRELTPLGKRLIVFIQSMGIVIPNPTGWKDHS